MNPMTRRRFLNELGLASGSLFVSASTGCGPTDHPSSELYVMLQGPWLLSAASGEYLRAMTCKQDGYQYDLIDPHPRASEAAAPALEARHGICLNAANLVYFDVCPAESEDLSKRKRARLFDGMRDQYQGFFYTDAVTVPKSLKGKNALELRLSYPQEIFAMGLQEDVPFENLTHVRGQKIEQWPTTIVLRYSTWKTASCFGNGLRETCLTRDAFLKCGQDQAHRKFTITRLLNSETALPTGASAGWTGEDAGCCKDCKCCCPSSTSKSCSPGQTGCCKAGCCCDKERPECCRAKCDADVQSRRSEEQYALQEWNAVMSLATFPYQEVPAPKYPCSVHPGNTHKEPLVGGDGTIVAEELKSVPKGPRGRTAVLSAAGSAGVHGASSTQV